MMPNTKILLIGSILASLAVAAVSLAAPAPTELDTTTETCQVGALDCPPPGLCAKAMSLCQRGDEQPWCDIMYRCLLCLE